LSALGASLLKFKGNATHLLRSNSPAILTALGVSGTLSTAYLAGKASYKAAHVIRRANLTFPAPGERRQRAKENFQLTWKLYIPAVTSGGLTIACIVMANRVGSKRTAAIAAAYSLSETALVEYREKVIEQFGERKEQAVRDELAQDKVAGNPPNREVIVAGSSDVLCHELLTGRYFRSDMETLRKAQNDINGKILRERYVQLSEFYYLVGLPYTSHSSVLGWDSDRLMELEFSTVLSEDNIPCIAFEYNYTKPV
jgi:Family of unknown function (DUF6353)